MHEWSGWACVCGHAYFSSAFLFTVVLANIFKFYAARAWCLTVTPCAHSVAMVACTAYSALDWC